MKNNKIEIVKFSKTFGENTDLVGGKTATWTFPSWESFKAVMNPTVESEPMLKFMFEAALDQVRHHLVSDWIKSDQRLLDDKNATDEEKKAAKLRMLNGYDIDFSKGHKLSSQLGNERSGQRWGKYSKYVPLAKTMVDSTLEVDSDEWKTAVIKKCEEIKSAMEVLKKG